MKPLTQNQLKNFIRYPKKQPKIFSPKLEMKPVEKNKPIPTPAESLNSNSGTSRKPQFPLPRYAQPKDNYGENKYITEQIRQFEKKQDAIMRGAVSRSPNPHNQKPKISNTNEEPGISSPVHSANAKIGNSGDLGPSPSVPSPGITSSERALLLYLLQMKYMTMDQIDRKFLNHQQSAMSFRKLLAGGYLKSKDGAPVPSSLIIPTEKAYDLLKIENPNKDLPKPTKRIFDPILNHDLKLVELRMRFEELNYLNKWFSEQELEEVPLMKRLFQDLPDAVCKKKNNKSYFLELEISQKSQKKYEERIALYEQVLQHPEIEEAEIEGVIFLCTDEKVYEIIKSKLPKSKSFSCLMLNRYLKTKEAAA